MFDSLTDRDLTAASLAFSEARDTWQNAQFCHEQKGQDVPAPLIRLVSSLLYLQEQAEAELEKRGYSLDSQEETNVAACGFLPENHLAESGE